MPVTLNASQIGAPGVFISESTAGALPPNIASFNRCYMIGTGTAGPYNTPQQVISLEDLDNQFGSVPAGSRNAVRLFFRNIPTGLLFFIRAKAPKISQITLGAAVAGTYSYLINGTLISYTANNGANQQDIISGLLIATQNLGDGGYIASVASTAVLRFSSSDPETDFTLSDLTAPAGSSLTLVANTNTPRSHFIYATEHAFEPEDEQGFLIAPEAFSEFSSQDDRTAVVAALEDWASLNDWMALVDSGPTTVISKVADADTEGQLYTTDKGHLAYYFPYVVDLEDQRVPPSAGVAAIALRKWLTEGFQSPPAGTDYTLNGVIGVATKVTRAQQDVVNPHGINVIRNIPRAGITVYGARTRSQSTYYRFINTRIIFNVLNRTLKDTFERGSVIFKSVDGQGLLFTRVRETAFAVCYRFWIGGALYGTTPADAFEVICDARNNPTVDLEAGAVHLDVYAAPAPTVEKLLIGTYRVTIGQVAAVAGAI